MAAAAITPRVRAMIICDAVEGSFASGAVCDLEGVRQEIASDTFPFAPHQLHLFLWLSSPRTGRFPATIKVIDTSTEKAIFYSSVHFTFDEAHTFTPSQAHLCCTFPHPGEYTVQVWFFHPHESDMLKAEQPFLVLE